ncbi:MAG: hypothetical protein WDN45_04605 [Caulobacteraceae bacterium]
MHRFAPRRAVSALTCAASLIATAALAQPDPAARPASGTTVAPVTIEGPSTPKVIEQQSYRFVQDLVVTGNPELDQVVRWRDPVCIRAAGLVPNQDQEIEARITEVAKALDLRVGKPGCKANVEIVFSDQPQTVLDQLYKRREYMLGYYHRHDGVRLKKVTMPIQAWHVTATIGGWGGVAGAEAQPHSEVIDDPENMPPAGCGINHAFTACLQGVFKNVFVIVDNSFLGDKSLGLVTDYLAMVALAQPRSLNGCSDLSSVIDLFAKAACPGRDAPDGLTPADASYLTALYSADPEQKKWAAESDISGRMAKILIKAGTRPGAPPSKP